MPTSRPAEQRLEKIGKVAVTALIGKIEIRAIAEMRWRMEFVAGPVTARAQLVVGLALGRILQRLVGFIDALELFLGAFFLADVGMIFAREFAIRGLDFRVAGRGLHAENVVVILELHRCETPMQRTAASIADRSPVSKVLSI